MGFNLTFTMCVGDKTWGQKALNWCLSVKNAHPKAKTALIHTASAIQGIEEYIHAYFDYTLQVGDEENPIAQSFRLKTEFYDIITGLVPEAEAYLFMDADTIMLSGRSVDEFFVELKDVDFTMWCNDVYDFATKKRMRDDYTFWCEPEEVNSIGFKKMPQVNSSFIFFRKGNNASILFDSAKKVYQSASSETLPLPHKKYKGTIPDELCFNLACAIQDILPHQIPYYPIFFSFASEHFEEQYIRNWKAIGFAGDTIQQDGVIHLYNHNVAYYRSEFDIEEPFVVGLPKDNKPKDRHPLAIEPASKRTIFRRDEVPNSGGGIFNPDGIYINDFGYVTIFRKEANTDFYKVGHNQSTAIPHLTILSKDGEESFELEYVNKPDGVRFEDFRIISGNEHSLRVSHTVISKNLTPKMKAQIGNSFINIQDKTFEYLGIETLPVEERKVEKNWVFAIEEDAMFCIYSLSPYRLFKEQKNDWKEVSVFQPEIDWFHKGHGIFNSTRPVLIGDDYLMLFHTREAGIYFQGAVIIDAKTKEITHYTKRSIPLRSYAEGFQQGLIYASGMLYVEHRNLLRIFFGEADSHSCSNDYDADEFVAMVKQNAVFESNNNSVLELLKQTT